MEGRLKPIKDDSYRPLREIVFETISNAIRTGALKPGERLMELSLAKELGVSRTPVREAIRKLELEGYVMMIPRRGTYVADVSIHDVYEVFEIRSALDSLASRLAAERISEDELHELHRLLLEIEKYIELDDINKIVKYDTKFHDLLYKASRNNRLVGIIFNLREQLTRFRRKSMSYPGRLRETLEEHRRIVDAIARGNTFDAQRVAEEHIEKSEQTFLKSIKDIKDKNLKKERDSRH